MYICSKKRNPRNTLAPNGRPQMRGRCYEVHGRYIFTVLFQSGNYCVVSVWRLTTLRGSYLASSFFL